jgi:hypothetical protein
MFFPSARLSSSRVRSLWFFNFFSGFVSSCLYVFCSLCGSSFSSGFLSVCVFFSVFFFLSVFLFFSLCRPGFSVFVFGWLDHPTCGEGKLKFPFLLGDGHKSLCLLCVLSLLCALPGPVSGAVQLLLKMETWSCYWRRSEGALQEYYDLNFCFSLLFVRPLFFSFPYGLFPNVLIWLH